MATDATTPRDTSPRHASVSETVIETVAARAGMDPIELPPLYDTVDPDALDALVDPTNPASSCTVAFRYAGLAVSVYSDGTVTVSDR